MPLAEIAFTADKNISNETEIDSLLAHAHLCMARHPFLMLFTEKDGCG